MRIEGAERMRKRKVELCSVRAIRIGRGENESLVYRLGTKLIGSKEECPGSVTCVVEAPAQGSGSFAKTWVRARTCSKRRW